MTLLAVTVATELFTAITYSGGLFFIAKYKGSGTAIWAKSGTTSPRQAWAYGVAVDKSGNAFITGAASPSDTDAFVAKYDSAGNVVWNRRLSGQSAGVRGNSIAIGPDGSVNITG